MLGFGGQSRTITIYRQQGLFQTVLNHGLVRHEHTSTRALHRPWQKTPEAQPGPTFYLRKYKHTVNSSSKSSSLKNFLLTCFQLELFSPSGERGKKTPAHLYKYKPSNILQSCVIASEFCYHIALLIRIQNISHHHGHILNIVAYLQLCLGFVLYKGSHSYITKLNHCSILCSSSAPTSRSICPCSLGRDDLIDS